MNTTLAFTRFTSVRKSRARRAVLSASLSGLAVALVALVGCGEEGQEKKAADAPAKKEKRKTRVEVATLEAVAFTSYETLTGETEADEELMLASEVPGVVVARNFKEGDRVEKGQWMVRLDTSLDRARMNQTQITIRQYKRDLDRTLALKEKGLATQADVERARLALSTSRANLQQLGVGVRKAVVKSPIDGYVERTGIDVGEYVGPGTPIATILGYDMLVVRAGLPESKLRYAREGQKVEVTLRALDEVRTGTVRRIGVQANTKNRTFPVEVALENKDRSLRSGMRADVRFETESFKDAVVAPRTALVQTQDSQIAFVLNGDTVERRVVKTGVGRGAYVVIEEGLKQGDKVVTVGQQFLTDKEPVEVVGESSCCTKQFADTGEPPLKTDDANTPAKAPAPKQ